ncbi:Retrovirus-related Pol polyprotein from transposon RE1 [Vitis vinifera]|uniref:Retrovirus-related Pol polyprotein from transposon RE1 n=1 Tax=Vitis vinifera TaxID=29760 RepID=A0A438HEX5_VITVI|nr:Retrovirus-related Pol polyprotein from transposon RE1 [Vitis vinifera]
MGRSRSRLRSELDFWTYFCSGMAFSLEYTLGKLWKIVFHHHGLRHEEGQEVQRTQDYLLSLKSPPKKRTLGKRFIFCEVHPNTLGVSPFEGEYHKEIQTLNYDYHISEEDESGQSELVNQEAGELDMSGQQFGSEYVFTEIPNQSSSVEGVLNLEPDLFMKRLPHRHNRAIPNSVQEALANPRWKAVMNEEMKSLQKNETRDLVECPPGKKPVRMHGVRKAMSEGVQIEEVIYGLKQSPRAWFGRFTKLMRAFSYRQIKGNDPKERKALQNYLSIEFEMKDLGSLKYFLGIEVSRLSEGIFLSQRKYVLDLLQETRMSGCQLINTPIEEGLKLCVEPNQVSTDKGRYQRLVGRLMYLAHTIPDLAYALSVVSQYMHNPGEQHMNAVMRILRLTIMSFIGMRETATKEVFDWLLQNPKIVRATYIIIRLMDDMASHKVQ